MNVTLEYRNLSNNQWTLLNSTFVLTDQNKFEVNFSSDFTFESTFYDFRVSVVDLDNAASVFYYNQSLKINNNLPIVGEIIPSEYVVNEESYLYLYSNFSDDVEVVNHEWESNLQGIIGNKSQISINTLIPGVHQITYRVTDNEGAQAEDSTQVRVNGIPRVDNLMLSNDVILSHQDLEAEFFASDDIGIVDFEWLLDGKYLDSFTNDDYLIYDIHLMGQENFLLGSEEIIEIQAQYSNNFGLVRSDRQEVFVGKFSNVDFVNDFSSSNSMVFLESINLTWQDQENGDDSCQWLFRIFENNTELDTIVADCLRDGTQLQGEEYYIGREYPSNIHIEIWYEGWNDVNLYLGESFSYIKLTDLGKQGQEFNFRLNNTDFIVDSSLDENIIHAISNYQQSSQNTRNKGDFAFIGRWGGVPVESGGEYAINNLTMAWISAGSDYETQCTWKLKVITVYRFRVKDAIPLGWSWSK